jgi:predicted protein tyrosine phosphatase
MKFLVLCVFGKNRSRFLAEYLSAKGFDVEYDGVTNEDKDVVQQKIDRADVIIAVNGDVEMQLRGDFKAKGKKIIVLDVDDRPETLLTDQAWTDFQQKNVYPKLIEQVNKALDIK